MSNPEYYIIEVTEKDGDGAVSCACDAAKKIGGEMQCRLAHWKGLMEMKKCYHVETLCQGNLKQNTILHCDAAAFFYAGKEDLDGGDTKHYFAVLQTKER